MFIRRRLRGQQGMKNVKFKNQNAKLQLKIQKYFYGI
jgi:hypothetical protein